MPRTKSWRFLSNIRSMLPLTIFKAMAAACDLCRFCLTGPSAFLGSNGSRATLYTVSHPPGTVCAGSAADYQARADEAEARRGVLCCAETLAMDQCRKWLTKWRLKSADLSIMRDSHMGIRGIKGPVPLIRTASCWSDTASKNMNKIYWNKKNRQIKISVIVPF